MLLLDLFVTFATFGTNREDHRIRFKKKKKKILGCKVLYEILKFAMNPINGNGVDDISVDF